MRLRPRIRSHHQRGQSLLETAMMMVVTFTVVFWIFELGQLMYTYAVLADAANEGVRYAIVHSGGDVAGTQARVIAFAHASMHDVSAMAPPSVTFPDKDANGNPSAAPPSRVRVTVTYTYVPSLGSFAPTMQTYAEGRMIVQ
jgi:Flp pilus assembly protein TadG